MKILYKSLPIILVLGLLQIAYRIYEYKTFPEKIPNFVWWAYFLFQIVIFLLLSQSVRSFKRLYLLAYTTLFGVAVCNVLFLYLLHHHIDTEYKYEIAEQGVVRIKERAETRAKEKGVKMYISESSLKEDYKQILRKYEVKGLVIDFLLANVFNLLFAVVWALIVWLIFTYFLPTLAILL